MSAATWQTYSRRELLRDGRRERSRDAVRRAIWNRPSPSIAEERAEMMAEGFTAKEANEAILKGMRIQL